MTTAKTTVTKSFLSKAPLVMVALPASYGVASFESGVYPSPWNWILGAAFESVYLGAIFLAENKSRRIFFVTVAIAVLCGVIYNTLHAAEVEGILYGSGDLWHWLLAFVHGAPLSAIGLSFAMLLHYQSNAPLQEELHTETIDAEIVQGHTSAIETLLQNAETLQAQVYQLQKQLRLQNTMQSAEPLQLQNANVSADSGGGGGVQPQLQDTTTTVALLVKDKKQQAIDLYLAKVGIPEISKQLECSERTVYNYLKGIER